MKLQEVAVILGCSKPAASLLKNGQYDRKTSDLPARYEQLSKTVTRMVAERSSRDIDLFCYSCPRQDCTGCRIAELKD